MIKTTNPAVIILSNYDLTRCYRKALDKDPAALDSLLTRLEIVEIAEGDPIDIDGFLEALALASLATTVTPTTSEVVLDLNVQRQSNQKELDQDSSTTETPESSTESQISTPPWMIAHQRPPTPPRSPVIYPAATPPSTPPQYQINEDELIPSTEEVVQRVETPYERFQRERREKMRLKEREESSIDRVERKGKRILFTGYN